MTLARIMLDIIASRMRHSGRINVTLEEENKLNPAANALLAEKVDPTTSDDKLATVSIPNMCISLSLFFQLNTLTVDSFA